MLIYESSKEKLDKLNNKINKPKTNEAYECCVRAYALRINERFIESVNEYKRALQVEPENIDALNGLIFCCQKAQEQEEALKYCNRLRRLTPFDKKVYYQMGCLEYELENYVSSIKCFIKAIKLSPQYYEAVYALGQSHEAIEEFEMASMIYSKIIEERPSYIKAYNNLGNLYVKMKEYKKAIEAYKKLISINPEFYKAYLGMAIAYDKAGVNFEARKYYKKYLKLKPFSGQREFVQTRLRDLRPSSSGRSTANLQLVR
ncbi:MAG: tetratricopeptide repeat protein [Candidatus Gastranaerophilales bacterium]|nr:tetratricopeptide repeat protein [Candidatus Gastranaerophilales bacterium]